jgi:hypothetical protein
MTFSYPPSYAPSYSAPPAPSYYNQQNMLNYAPTSTYAPSTSLYYTDNSKFNYQPFNYAPRTFTYADNSTMIYNPKVSVNGSSNYASAYGGGGSDPYFPQDFSSFSNPSTYAVIGGGFGGGFGDGYGKPPCHRGGYHHPHHPHYPQGGYGGTSYGGGYGSTAYGTGSNGLDIVKQLYPNGYMDPKTFFSMGNPGLQGILPALNGFFNS